MVAVLRDMGIGQRLKEYRWAVAATGSRRVCACNAVAGCSGSVRLSDAVEGEVPPTTAVVAPPVPDCRTGAGRQEPTRSFEPLDPLPSPDDLPQRLDDGHDP